MSLPHLADRCDRVGKPDRELDLAVAKAVGKIPAHYRFNPTVDGGEMAWGGICGMDVPRYTASIDAAMTLVGYANGRPHNLVIASAYGSAYIVPNDGASYGINDRLKGEGRAQGDNEIDRTARAITAAALRASHVGGIVGGSTTNAPATDRS